MPLIQIGTFGGEVPRLNPDDMPLNIATTALDVDLSVGDLSPWKTDKKISDKTGLVIWNDDCKFLSFDSCNVSIAQEDLTCKRLFTTGDGYPKYATFDDAAAGLWTRLDMPCAMPALSASTVTAVVKDFTFEQVTFVYTLVNGMGDESGPSHASSLIPVNDSQTVLLSGLPTNSNGHNFTEARIYATRSVYQAPQSQVKATNGFFLLATVPYGTTTATIQFGPPGTALITDDDHPMPVDAWDISHWRSGHLSALADNKLRFSAMRQWTNWPDSYTINVPGTARRHLAGMGWGYVLTDERPLAVKFEAQQKANCHQAVEYHEPLPIIACRSAAMHGDTVVYATNNGLVHLSGANAVIISQRYFDARSWQSIHPDQMVGAVFEGHYFGFTDNYAFRMALPGTAYVESRPDAGLTSLSIRPKALFVTRDGRLLFATDLGIFQWNAGDEFKPYTWERKSWRLDAPMGMVAWALDWKYGHPSSVTHWRNNHIKVATQIPTTNSMPYRLSHCKSRHYGVTIQGTSQVTRYRLASGIRDLPRNSS